MIENEDYQLIPSETDLWHVKILTGDFSETTIQYSVLKLHENRINFNFKVVFSPYDDEDLAENEALQGVAGIILYDILENIYQKDENAQSGTDDNSEHSDE